MVREGVWKGRGNLSVVRRGVLGDGGTRYRYPTGPLGVREKSGYSPVVPRSQREAY